MKCLYQRYEDTEIDEYENDLREKIMEIDAMFLDNSYKEKINIVEDKLKRSKELLESLTLEIRINAKFKIYEERKEIYRKKINEFMKKLNPETSIILNNAEQYRTDQLIDKGIELQGAIITSLGGSERNRNRNNRVKKIN